MSPKEKAKRLIDKYYNLFAIDLENTISMYEAAHCALIAVDEILNEPDCSYDYWQEVKQEIEKL